MRFRLLALLGSALLVAPLVATAPPTAEASDRFSDGHTTIHTSALDAVAEVGVAGGYPDGTYRPRQAVSRDQMGTFLMRALQLDEAADHDFVDVPADSLHNGAIGAIANQGVTQGCSDDEYCPRDDVTRAQMATFLMRAFDLDDDAGQSFTDVDSGDDHAQGIRAVAAAGITLGCTDDGSRFCPGNPIERGQMAAFLERALELEGPTSCPTPSSTEVEDFGAAVPPENYLTTAAVRADDGLEVLSSEQEVSRSARVDEDEITGTATIDEGDRTWATEVVDGEVYAGQWGVSDGAETLWSFPAEDGDSDRQAEAVAHVPTGGEFWDLAADDEGRLYTATRAHNSGGVRSEVGLQEDEHVIHRIDTDTREVEAITFPVPGDMPRDDQDRRPDVKQVAWVDGTLYVGLGQQNEGARLFALDDLDADDPEVTDITPESLEEHRAVFSLDVTDEVIALGTQISDDEEARVIALDRDHPTGAPLADVALEVDGTSDDRVDAIHVDGDRVLAGSFPSGGLSEVDLGTGQATQLDVPIASSTTRFLEVDDDGDIVGLSGTGRIWTHADGSTDDPVNIAQLEGAPVADGRAHSLDLTDDHIVAGASNIVHLHDRTSPGTSHTLDIGGEVKAMAAGDGRLFAATYPTSELWEIDEDRAEATQVHEWTNSYNRPRDATYHQRGSTEEVLVVARNDDTGHSRLFALAPDGSGSSAGTVILDHEGEPVEALSVTAHGNTAYVGTRNGAVRAINLDTRQSRWVTRPGSSAVESLEVVDGRIVGLARTNINDRGQTWFELDPEDSDDTWLRRGRGDVELGHGDHADGAAFGPVSITAKGQAVVAIDRAADRATTLHEHAPHGTFAGPYLTAGDDCSIHVVGGRQLLRLPYDPATRLD